MDNGGGTHQESPPNWSEYDARGVAEEDLTWLPDATRALVEECRAQSKQPNGGAAGSPAEALPYTRRLYEKAVPGEEDLLQLQWMRIDMSTMDSELCWGERSQNDEHDCGPDSGMVLPKVYSLDPAQLISCTPVGLPPELQRSRQGSSDAFDERVPDEVPEDRLFKLGRNLTEALSSEAGSRKQAEGLRPDVVDQVVALSGADWSVCLERYVDLPRCDPTMLARVISAAAPPTLDCLLNMVLPAVITRVSSPHVAANAPTSRAREEAGTGTGRNGQRDIAAVHAICGLAASVAASTASREGGGADPVRFRERVSGSELRKLGPLGREAEVALAEAFFYGGSEAIC